MCSYSVSSRGEPPFPLCLDNQSCAKTLRKYLTINLKHIQDSPLYRCIQLIHKEILDYSTIPIHSIRESQPFNLLISCKKTLQERLITKIKVGTSEVRPIDWLSNILVEINKLNPNSVIYHNTYISGSGAPMTRNYWEYYLNCLPNLDRSMHAAFLDTLSSPGKVCYNIDAMMSVQMFGQKNEDEKLQIIAMTALQNSLVPHLSSKEIGLAMRGENRTVKGPSIIRDLGLVFTIGSDVTFDLLFWKKHPEFPELYSQQGHFTSVGQVVGNDLINWPIELWPEIPSCFIGVTPSMFLIDRCVNILRFNPQSYIGAKENIGLLKKYLIMLTKGALCVQSGLLIWILKIYLQAHKTTKSIAHDVNQSFIEHLPKTLGACIAHRLHWMMVLNECSDALAEDAEELGFSSSEELRKTLVDAQSVLGKELDFPNADDGSDYLKLTYHFLKQHPNRLFMLIAVLEFTMLLSFLKDFDQAVTCGILEGVLAFRLPMDYNASCYLQRQIHPKQTLKKIARIFSQKSVSVEVRQGKNAVKGVLKACFVYWGLDEEFDFNSQALTLLESYGST